MPPRKGPAPAQAQPTRDKDMHRVGCAGQHGCWEVLKAPTTTALSPPHSVQLPLLPKIRMGPAWDGSDLQKQRNNPAQGSVV